MVLYYNAILKVIANVAAATTIVASEKRNNARYGKLCSEILAVARRMTASFLFKTY